MTAKNLKMSKQFQYSRIYNFKKSGRYYTFKKDLYDDTHNSNYVNAMIRKGYVFVGIFYVDNNGNATTNEAFKNNLYTD